ncbi:MAG: hypothetical protein Q4D19_13095 [Lautropia sp.]|nr:hypothetical protein [Lautropia sp.]
MPDESERAAAEEGPQQVLPFPFDLLVGGFSEPDVSDEKAQLVTLAEQVSQLTCIESRGFREHY